MQGGGLCHLWRSPSGEFKHLFLLLDLSCEPDAYPGVIILTNQYRTRAIVHAVQDLRRELPGLLSSSPETPVAYWWLEQDAKKLENMVSELTDRPVLVG